MSNLKLVATSNRAGIDERYRQKLARSYLRNIYRQMDNTGLKASRGTMAKLVAKNEKIRRSLVGVVVVFLWTVPLQISALAEDDPLQKAINYLFTGRLDPQDVPEILDRKSCVVVVSDTKFKIYVKYYLGRFALESAVINKTYAGSEAAYTLDVKGAEVIVEYLDIDKRTVLHEHNSAQILLPGNIDLTNKALQIISSRCKNEKPKVQF